MRPRRSAASCSRPGSAMITMGLVAIEHRAGPGGVLAAESDVDAAGEMALGELGGVADVEDLRARISQVEDFVELDGLQNLFEIAVERGALAGVEDGVVGEVLRSVGLVGGDEADELLLRHGLQRVVEAALDRRAERRCRRRAACRRESRRRARGRRGFRRAAAEACCAASRRDGRRDRWRSSRARRAGRGGRRRR